MDSQNFRDAMRGFAGTVTVITAGRPGRRAGLTATSVCSVSDSPPALLVCVNRNTVAHEVIRAERAFGINVLARDHEDIAACFAGRTQRRGDDRFLAGTWQHLVTGVPILADAAIAFDCELATEHVYDTHSIFVGIVRDLRMAPDADPLLYHRGAFTSAQSSGRQAA